MSLVQSPTSFIEFRKLTVKAGQRKSVNIFGRVFVCSKASGSFRMNFNDGEFFDVKGAGGEWALVGEDRYSRLQFTAETDTDIEFYGGNFFYHENVVIPIVKVAPTFTRVWLDDDGNPTLAAGASVTLDDVPAGFTYRKAIVVTNDDPALDLDIYARNTGDATWRPAGVVFAKQCWILETSDELRIKNNGASDMNVRILELFYS